MPRRFPLQSPTLLLLTAILTVFTPAKGRAQLDPPLSPKEVAAVACLKAIDAAEETFRFGNLAGSDNYASLANLRSAGLADWPGEWSSDNYSFVSNGYEFRDVESSNPWDWGQTDWGVYAVSLGGPEDRIFVVTMDHRIRWRPGPYGSPSDLASAQTDSSFPVVETDGDVDGNGFTEVGDAVLALRAVAGVVPLTEEQSRRADVTQDAQVDIRDAVMTLKMALTGPRNWGEWAAIEQLRQIWSAQETFKYRKLGGYGKYSTLAQLRTYPDFAVMMAWPSESNFEKGGYLFGDVPSPDDEHWGAYAVPLKGTVGRTLVVTMSDQIRAGHGNVPPADLQSTEDGRVWPVIIPY